PSCSRNASIEKWSMFPICARQGGPTRRIRARMRRAVGTPPAFVRSPVTTRRSASRPTSARRSRLSTDSWMSPIAMIRNVPERLASAEEVAEVGDAPDPEAAALAPDRGGIDEDAAPARAPGAEDVHAVDIADVRAVRGGEPELRAREAEDPRVRL